MCSWALRCLLIEDGDRRILIDTGMGNKQSEKFFGYYYLHGNDTMDKSLAKYGFTKDDITDVVLTHLHFDHCGGAILKDNDKLVPAFKNAVYWSNEKHWKWATEPNEREKASFLSENILPIRESGSLKFIQLATDDKQLTTDERLPQLSFFIANGHTDAMMLPVININDKTIVFVADLLPATAHIPLPYIMGYDMFPMKTLEEKKRFLHAAVENNYTLFFEHDPVTECCTVAQTEKGIRVKETFTLSQLFSS